MRKSSFSTEIFQCDDVQGDHDDGREGPVPSGHGGADAQVHPQPRGASAAGRARRRDRSSRARRQILVRVIQV